MDEITIIAEVTNKKHSDNYKYSINQSNGHSAIHRLIVQKDIQRSTDLRVYVFLLHSGSKIVKFMSFVVPFKHTKREEHTRPLLYSPLMCEPLLLNVYYCASPHVSMQDQTNKYTFPNSF